MDALCSHSVRLPSSVDFPQWAECGCQPRDKIDAHERHRIQCLTVDDEARSFGDAIVKPARPQICFVGLPIDPLGALSPGFFRNSLDKRRRYASAPRRLGRKSVLQVAG